MTAKNRIWFDFEFVEFGGAVVPLSVGLVREDLTGELSYYYAEFAGLHEMLDRASPWVIQNVVPHLDWEPKPKWNIQREITAFCGESPEFWGYFADYDWFLMCSLFGGMLELPDDWPMLCLDVKQAHLAHPTKADSLLPEQTNRQHHALDDAVWTREAWLWLRGSAK